MTEHLIPASLRAAIVNQRIYPSGSPIVERSVAQTVQALESALKAADRVTLNNKQGRIFLKAKELPGGEPLAALLDEFGVQSITFLRGVTAAEIAQLVLVLSDKKAVKGDMGESLKNRQVAHIVMDKATLVEVMPGDVVMKKMDQLFEGVRDFPALVGSLREAYDMIDQVPAGEERAGTEEHLARRLAGLPPDLLRDMFENSLPKRVEDSGMKPMVLNAMTQDKIQDIFSEIGQWYRQVRTQASSDFEVVEHLNRLKSFLGKLLSAPGSKAVPFALYEELLKDGLLEEIPPDVKPEPEADSLARQVDGILNNPAARLLEMPLRDQVPTILKRLCGVGLDDLFQKMVDRIAENFGHGTPLVRQMSVKLARQTLDIARAHRKDRLAQNLLHRLESLEETERSADAYQEIAEALAGAAVHGVLNQHLSEAVGVIRRLRRQQNDPDPTAPKKAELAGQALLNAVEQILDVVSDDLLSDEPSRRDAGQTVLAELGEAAAPCLLRIIEKSPDLRQRRWAADTLRLHGPKAQNLVVAEIHPGQSTDVLLRLLSVLEGLAGPEAMPALEKLVHFPDPAVRRRILAVAAKIKPPEGPGLVRLFLEDPDEALRLDAIRAAGEAKDRDAVPALLELVKEGPTSRREEVCLSLGRIRDERALPVLLEIVEVKSGLFKKRAASEETIRVRAAWALTQISSSAAREALARAANDPNLQIQAIARQALGTHGA
jgi:HEAT repeat protein